MADDPRALLRLDRLVVGYAGKPLLPPIDVEVREGEFWVLLGRNGAGKTTVLRTILGLVPPVSGAVRQPAGPLRLGYLAQHVAFDPLYPVSVRDMVADGTLRGWSFLRPGPRPTEVVDRALHAVGIADLARRRFRSLSGGQKQRTLFARMLATGAELVLLDEPTQGMDALAAREVLDLLVRLKAEYGLTVIVVTHHLDVAQQRADRVLFLDAEHRAVRAGPTAQVLRDPAFEARYGPVLQGAP